MNNLAKLKVSGEIINELSEKIPTFVVALNELIKNSFDANASNVNINFDTRLGILLIQDDGDGMDESNIETLLHVSKSNKKYAEINEHGRYIQGSKGLGFLSVFKFGSEVTWRTRKDKGYEFTINYDEVTAVEDINDLDIEVLEKTDIAKGTTIIMKMKEYGIDALKKYLDNMTNLKKILYSFNIKDLNIAFKIDDILYNNSSPIELDNILLDRQLFHVNYNSDEERIIFKHNNHIAFEHEFKFSYTDFRIDLDLVIFSLNPYDKKKINDIFYNSTEQLTPLVYVNTCIFNNYNLFDPYIMQKIKYSSIMNQIIGHINIYSSNKMLDFNSDRTQFVQNTLTDSISAFISNINIAIQTEASERKKHLIDFDILMEKEFPNIHINSSVEELRKIIKEDFAFKDKVIINKNGGIVEYLIFGKKICVSIDNTRKITSPNQKVNSGKSGSSSNGQAPAENNYVPASIKLTTKYKKLPIPTEQIDLYSYIESAENSERQVINNKEILITVEGMENKTGILECITESSCIKVGYSYLDNNTGTTYSELVLDCYQPNSGIFGSNDEDNLISIPSIKSYTINYSSHVNNLINQINGLELDKYEEVIACSLRAIFEISIDALIKSRKFNNLLANISGLENEVSTIIEYISNCNALKSKISTNSRIDFKSLKNILDKETYISIIRKAHLGAHKSTTYISKNDIKELAKKAGMFVVFINEMLN